MDYEDYICRKLAAVVPTGIRNGFSLPNSLFPHQAEAA